MRVIHNQPRDALLLMVEHGQRRRGHIHGIAMGCQTEVARTIRDEGGDDALALKGNQGRLHGDVEALFAEALAAPDGGLAHQTHRAVDGGHGRIAIRQAWVIDDPATLRSLDPDGRWPDLRRVGMVQAERRVGTEVSRETRSYLSSLAASARTLNDAVRSHGGSENKAHRVLDLAFREDESRARTGESARNLAVLRHRALHLLRRESTALWDHSPSSHSGVRPAVSAHRPRRLRCDCPTWSWNVCIVSPPPWYNAVCCR